jgi:hypothetical protein
MLTERPETSPNAPWNRRVSLLSPLASILLCGAPMRHLLALALLALALPSVGHAQTLTTTLIGIEGDSSPSLTDLEVLRARGVSKAHCDDPTAVLRFRLQSMTGSTFPTVVDIWHDGGSSTRNCSAATERSMNVMDRSCIHLAVTNRGLEAGVIEIPLSEIAAGDPDTGSGGAANGSTICTANRTSYNFYFFDTNANPFTAELASTNWGRVAVAFDGVLPTAPTVEAAQRNRQGSAPVPISWNAVTPDPTTNEMRYQVYRATGGCDSDGGTVTRGATVGSIVGPNVTESSVSEAGGYVVTAIDASNNESAESSEVICVEVVPTVGFCDVREGGCPSGCSAGSTRAGGTAAVLVFLGLVLARRRKLV